MPPTSAYPAPPLQPALPSLKQCAHVIHDQTCAAQVVGQHNDGSSARGTWAARANGFPNHLSFVRTQKWIWGPSAFIRFWDHPPTATAWGKLVKVAHRPPAPHSPAPSWTTGHHCVPPAAAPRARKVGPKVLAQNYFSWSLFGPKFRPMGQMLHWQCPFPTQSAGGTRGGRPPPPPEHFPCL
jgi:hypothetical protein